MGGKGNAGTVRGDLIFRPPMFGGQPKRPGVVRERRTGPAFYSAKDGEKMLILSRQREESIMIGDDTEITVVGIRGGKVLIGITAPKSISVHRKEVYLAIKAELEKVNR